MNHPSRPPASPVAPSASPRTGSRWIPYKVAAYYLVFSFGWIGLFSFLLHTLGPDPAQAAQLEVYKDWAFCLLSA